MIVPKYWAESHIRDKVRGRMTTIRRFGWSDESREDAQAVADKRAREAFDRIAAGETLVAREPKVPYNGAEGVPIREEIVDKHDDTVVTRNSYGARCLNTPDVLFADIDFETDVGTRLFCGMILLLILGAVSLGIATGLWQLAAVGVGASFLLGPLLAAILHRLKILLAGGHEGRARKRIERFLASHPDWHVRLYRTPAGYRALALHRTFDPREEEALEFFRALGTDKVYVTMCRKQNCFRARLSPKPWRIGIAEHLRPNPGVWPVRPEYVPTRNAWIERYEQAARDFAACRFVDTFGSGKIHQKARAVQRLHDDLCKAQSGLPIG